MAVGVEPPPTGAGGHVVTPVAAVMRTNAEFLSYRTLSRP